MSEIPSTLKARKDILETVTNCVTVGRNVQYGDAAQNFHDTAAIWNVILRRKLNEPVTGKDVSVMMAGLKMARFVHDPNDIDTFVDMAGYAVCGGGIALAEQQAKKDAQEAKPASINDLPIAQSHWIGKQDPVLGCTITPEFMEETHQEVIKWHARNPSFPNASIYLSGKTFQQYMEIAETQICGEYAYREIPDSDYQPSIFASSVRSPYFLKMIGMGFGGIVDLIQRRAEERRCDPRPPTIPSQFPAPPRPIATGSLGANADIRTCPPPINIFTQK